MDLDSLRIVVAAAEHGSTLGASRVLPWSRATIRRRLEALDSSLGVQLFHRTSQGLIPTDAGLVLIRRGREVLAEMDALAATVREVAEAPRGELRCCIPPGSPPTASLLFYRLIRELIPAVRLRTHVGNCELHELLVDFDFAVVVGREEITGPYESIVTMPIPIRLLASPEYLALHPPISKAADLAGHDFLAWVEPNRDAPTKLPRINGPDIPFEPTYSCNDIFLVRQLAIQGLGIALVPDGYVEPLEPPGSLVAVLPDLIQDELQIRLVVARAVADAPRVGAVMDLLRQTLAAGRGDGARWSKED